MKVYLRNSSVFPMFELCQKHKKGLMKREELEKLLDHEDYRVEFKRYGNKKMPMCTISKEEFVDYFMNIFNLKVEDIENERFRIHHEYYINFFNHLDEIEQKTKELFNTISVEDICRGLEYTKAGILESEMLDELNVIFTVSIGNSFGWAYDNCIHFDIVNYFTFMSNESFDHFIGHEVHHSVFSVIMDKFHPDESKMPLEDFLYMYFAYEGLAVKYCNNMEGVLTERIYKNEPANVGMDEATWEYFIEAFEDMFTELKKDIHDIRDGKISSNQDVWNRINEYWQANFKLKDGSPNMHSRNYYMGASIWGAIHDVFGKDKVFEVVENLDLFPEVYNAAIKAKGLDEKYLI